MTAAAQYTALAIIAATMLATFIALARRRP